MTLRVRSSELVNWFRLLCVYLKYADCQQHDKNMLYNILQHRFPLHMCKDISTLFENQRGLYALSSSRQKSKLMKPESKIVIKRSQMLLYVWIILLCFVSYVETKRRDNMDRIYNPLPIPNTKVSCWIKATKLPWLAIHLLKTSIWTLYKKAITERKTTAQLSHVELKKKGGSQKPERFR